MSKHTAGPMCLLNYNWKVACKDKAACRAYRDEV